MILTLFRYDEMKNSVSSFRWFVFFVLMSVISLILVARRAGNLAFYMLLLLSLITIVCRFRPINKSFFQFLKDYWPLHLAMAGILFMNISIFCNLINNLLGTY